MLFLFLSIQRMRLHQRRSDRVAKLLASLVNFFYCELVTYYKGVITESLLLVIFFI